MSTPENEIKLNGDVIPFKPKKTVTNTRKTTTIAAVVAVTVTHKTEISPEDKLFEIIENTGEAEILETADAFDLIQNSEIVKDKLPELLAANDN